MKKFITIALLALLTITFNTFAGPAMAVTGVPSAGNTQSQADQAKEVRNAAIDSRLISEKNMIAAEKNLKIQAARAKAEKALDTAKAEALKVAAAEVAEIEAQAKAAEDAATERANADKAGKVSWYAQ